MSRIKTLLALTIGSFITFGCEEIPPQITPCQTNRVVLVEEFTGIKCVNCPTGSEKLEVLSKQNPGQVIVVGIHAGYFAQDVNGFDLKCQDGADLEANYLGPVSGYPSASINRKVFEGKSDVITGLAEWAGYIGSEICQRPDVELAATSTYTNENGTGKASITVDITPGKFFTDPLNHDLALTIMITESNIKGYQLTPSGTKPEYKHKHVLRDVVSDNYSGDVIVNKGTILSQQQKVVTNYTLGSDWDPDHCHVIAFVHYKDDANKAVLQAIEIDLK